MKITVFGLLTMGLLLSTASSYAGPEIDKILSNKICSEVVSAQLAKRATLGSTATFSGDHCFAEAASDIVGVFRAMADIMYTADEKGPKYSATMNDLNVSDICSIYTNYSDYQKYKTQEQIIDAKDPNCDQKFFHDQLEALAGHINASRYLDQPNMFTISSQGLPSSMILTWGNLIRCSNSEHSQTGFWK